MIPTPHIEVENLDQLAKTVIMPGDPLRARYIAKNYLEDAIKVNTVRGMLAYTGTYKGHKVTVMGSGMGVPSMGIYSYELFKFYDVERIIRVGSSGAYTKDLNLYDVVLAKDTYAETKFVEIVTGEDKEFVKPTKELNDEIKKSAERQSIKLKEVRVHCSDVFYRKNFNDFEKLRDEKGCECVDMESAALFANAQATGKQGAVILTISDNLVTHELTTAEERQNSFTKMMEVALGVLDN